MTNLSESERADLARELDTANDYLLRVVSSDDDRALSVALGYGVAALCRFASETIRPPQGKRSQDDPAQLRLWSNDS